MMKHRYVQRKKQELRKEENDLVKIEGRLRKQEVKDLRERRGMIWDDSSSSDSDSSSDDSIDVKVEGK